MTELTSPRSMLTIGTVERNLLTLDPYILQPTTMTAWIIKVFTFVSKAFWLTKDNKP